MSSTFEVPIIKIKLEPHSNADSLSIVKVFGWQVVTRTDEWKDGDLAAYIRPDSVVPDTSLFAFLEGKFRIKTRRFRGEWSHGLLVKSPEGAKEGDNVAELLGVINYEPPEKINRQGPPGKPKTRFQKLMEHIRELGVRPRGKYPHYDMEHLRRYPDIFSEGELILVTEKLHGMNSLFTCRKPWIGRKKIFMRSRTVWKWRTHSHNWAVAFKNTPTLETFLFENPGLVVYGEVYGAGIQDLSYGKSVPSFAAFDIWKPESREWMNRVDSLFLLYSCNVPIVPILYNGPFMGIEHLVELSNKNSTLALENGKVHLSEGVVVTGVGDVRKILKVVSDKYLERSK